MNQKELTEQFDKEMMAEYSEHISEQTLVALKSCIAKIPYEVLGVPPTEYFILLDSGKEVYNYKQ